MAGVVSPVKYLNYEPTQAVHRFSWSAIRFMFVPGVRVIPHFQVRTQRPGCCKYNSASASAALTRVKKAKGYGKPYGINAVMMLGKVIPRKWEVGAAGGGEFTFLVRVSGLPSASLWQLLFQ